MLAVMLMGAAVIAQPQQGAMRTPQERVEKQMSWMQQNLGLTEDQGRKVKEILLRHAQDADRMHSEPKGREKNMDRREMQANFHKDMAEVLTADQLKKYEAHVEEMKARMRERRNAQMQGEY